LSAGDEVEWSSLVANNWSLRNPISGAIGRCIHLIRSNGNIEVLFREVIDVGDIRKVQQGLPVDTICRTVNLASGVANEIKGASRGRSLESGQVFFFFFFFEHQK